MDDKIRGMKKGACKASPKKAERFKQEILPRVSEEEEALEELNQSDIQLEFSDTMSKKITLDFDPEIEQNI